MMKTTEGINLIREVRRFASAADTLAEFFEAAKEWPDGEPVTDLWKWYEQVFEEVGKFAAHGLAAIRKLMAGASAEEVGT
jgi:hypothetical protein